ncbi:DUF883 family protein [Oleiharenicola lentus]|uniref:DUF883 family protein n=1 Tax=Oleiharenicola lentus TaxID=2508720 RepID=UPI003F67C39D
MKSRTAQSPEKLVGNLRDLLSEAEKLVGDASEGASAKAEDIHSRIELAQEKLSEYYDIARDKVVSSAKTADKTIRSHPYESLAIALGVGVLIGALIKSNRS